jgi:hypothetical protein
MCDEDRERQAPERKKTVPFIKLKGRCGQSNNKIHTNLFTYLFEYLFIMRVEQQTEGQDKVKSNQID